MLKKSSNFASFFARKHRQVIFIQKYTTMQHAEYGHFDDANREYVITNPKTPFPWINYLGNEDFFGLISNTAGG